MDVNRSDWIVMIMCFSFPAIAAACLTCVLPTASASLAEFIIDQAGSIASRARASTSSPPTGLARRFVLYVDSAVLVEYGHAA